MSDDAAREEVAWDVWAATRSWVGPLEYSGARFGHRQGYVAGATETLARVVAWLRETMPYTGGTPSMMASVNRMADALEHGALGEVKDE